MNELLLLEKEILAPSDALVNDLRSIDGDILLLGAGGKMDPSRVHVTNLPNTFNCNLASHIKKNLKRRSIDFKSVKAVYSSEAQQKEDQKNCGADALYAGRRQERA